MKIQFISTGGTIDKIYFDALSQFEVGDSVASAILTDALVDFDYDIVALLKKDSIEMTDSDRTVIRMHIENDPNTLFVVTHGTDTMVDTAQALHGIPGKTVVLTGSMQPARQRVSDAIFNIGFAVGALQQLPAGVYIAMNGEVFNPAQVAKNRAAHRFEVTSDG